MPKEGEGAANTRGDLQKATGQGKIVQGIKYPSPSLNVLATIEQQFGSLAQLGEQLGNPNSSLHARAIRMLIFLMEMQKQGKEDEIAMMDEKEVRGAAARFISEKGITIENLDQYRPALEAVFLKAPRRVKKK